MTDYNDGMWHGWNGGECPVHPKSEVEAVWHDPNYETAGMTGPRRAKEDDHMGPTLAWGHVVKFRVITPYREPRVMWGVLRTLRNTEDEAKQFLDELVAENPGLDFGTVTKWQEVIE